MIGLITLLFIGASIWVAKGGWASFTSDRQQDSITYSELIQFLGLSALLGVIMFVASAALFSGRYIYGFSFAIYMTVINIGALWLLALLVRLIPTYGVTISNAMRVACGFFVIYWFTLADPITKLFGIHLGV